MWATRRLRAKTPNNPKDSDCETSSEGEEEEISARVRSRKLAGSFYTRALIAAVPGFSDSANSL